MPGGEGLSNRRARRCRRTAKDRRARSEALLRARLVQGYGGLPGVGTDLSEVSLLGVLQSELVEAMEMMDICL